MQRDKTTLPLLANRQIYLAGPISGLSYKQACKTRNELCDLFGGYGIEAITPLRGKSYLSCERRLKPSEYEYPLSTDKAIINRDYGDVVASRILLADMRGAKTVSIGTCFELAWAWDHKVFSIVVMEKRNPHQHAFVKQAATVVVETMDEAVDTVKRYFGVEE